MCLERSGGAVPRTRSWMGASGQLGLSQSRQSHTHPRRRQCVTSRDCSWDPGAYSLIKGGGQMGYKGQEM